MPSAGFCRPSSRTRTSAPASTAMRRAPDAIRADPARRDPREQQRLVADRPGVVEVRVDPGRDRPASRRRSRATERRPGGPSPISIRASAIAAGVLPAPPATKLPTQTTGRARPPAGLAPCGARRPTRRARRSAGARGRAPSGGRRRQKPGALTAPIRRPAARARAPSSSGRPRRPGARRRRRRPRHRPEPRSVGEKRDQRIAEVVRVGDFQRPARVVERRIDVGEIGDLRPVQDGGGEPRGLDRVLPSPAGRRTCRRTRRRPADRRVPSSPIVSQM